MMGRYEASVLVLVMMSYCPVLSSSNLTSQQWIDFVSEQPGGLEKYLECLAGHSCDSISQENTEALNFMEAVTGINATHLRDSGSSDLCSCNLESCVRYGTCCRDALNGTAPKPKVSTSCINPGCDNGAFYANVKCPPEITDSKIIDLCNTPINRQSSIPGNISRYTNKL